MVSLHVQLVYKNISILKTQDSTQWPVWMLRNMAPLLVVTDLWQYFAHVIIRNIGTHVVAYSIHHHVQANTSEST